MSAGLRRVLIVDDDETYRTALARAFERRGFSVSAAGCWRRLATKAD